MEFKPGVKLDTSQVEDWRTPAQRTRQRYEAVMRNRGPYGQGVPARGDITSWPKWAKDWAPVEMNNLSDWTAGRIQAGPDDWQWDRYPPQVLHAFVDEQQRRERAGKNAWDGQSAAIKNRLNADASVFFADDVGRMNMRDREHGGTTTPVEKPHGRQFIRDSAHGGSILDRWHADGTLPPRMTPVPNQGRAGDANRTARQGTPANALGGIIAALAAHRANASQAPSGPQQFIRRH